MTAAVTPTDGAPRPVVPAVEERLVAQFAADGAAASRPVVRPGVVPPPTKFAQREAIEIAAGKLERDERIRWHLYYGAVIAFWTLVAAGLSLLLIWVYHLVAPQSRQFLTVEQRYELQTIVLSAIGSSFVTAMARRWARTMQDE